MPDPSTGEPAADPRGKAVETGVLFADLVSSSEFSSILSLEAYAEYVAAFEEICVRQCEYFFDVYHEGFYKKGRDYRLELLGDELVVFLHTTKQDDNVYQLIYLAVTLKCAWLGSPVNAERIRQGAPSAELAIGIHAGLVWAVPDPRGLLLRGFAINVAKRVETVSREGEHFRIMISGAAFKRINRQIRNLLIGPKRLVPMKGIVLPVAVHEVVDSFLWIFDRLHPAVVESFRSIARRAIASSSFDMWIHSCFQLVEGQIACRVTDECMELCRDVLAIQPNNGVALYYSAEGLIERNDLEAAILLLTDLTKCWPTFTQGWLRLAWVAMTTGNRVLAAHCTLQSRRQGATPEELEQLKMPE
jgi:class 3 adenylate cyclase